MTDTALRKAILKSQRTVDQFLAVFDNPGPAQREFMVVVLEELTDALVPVGILVDEHCGDKISGRKVENDLESKVTNEKYSCHRADIVDWRYVDSLELVGAATYRELYKRQHRRVQFTIRDAQPYMIQRNDASESDLISLYRDVANARLDNLKGIPDSVFVHATATMPVFSFDLGLGVVERPVTIPEYAAMCGNHAVIGFLHEKGILNAEADEYSLLCQSSYAGNLATTERLLELGFDVNRADKFGSTPLIEATRSDHVVVVELLLKNGADPNVRDRTNGKSAIFRAVSVEAARALVNARADINAVDANGDSCLAVQLSRGMRHVVRFLTESGAELKYGARAGVISERRVDGRQAILDWLESTGSPDLQKEFAIADSVDYGCVLPVKSFAVSVFE